MGPLTENRNERAVCSVREERSRLPCGQFPAPNTPPLRAVLRLVHTYADWSSFPLPCSTKLQRTARRLTDWRFRSRTNAEGFPMEHLTNANTTHTG